MLELEWTSYKEWMQPCASTAFLLPAPIAIHPCCGLLASGGLILTYQRSPAPGAALGGQPQDLGHTASYGDFIGMAGGFATM